MARSTSKTATQLAGLPEWNLGDLYASMDSPALATDIASALDRAKRFEENWKGRLSEEAARGTAGRLGQAIREIEELEELIGKIVSYAGLLYSGDTSDPARAKLYGDIQEKMTDASTHLLFFGLELNLIEDDVLENAFAADQVLAHYKPWVLDLRREKPYQLEDRIEQLFHEKSITSRGAWDRLFNETMSALRFSLDGQEQTLEPTLNKLQDPDTKVRQAASDALAATFKANLRTFTLITNTLAKDLDIGNRWRGYKDFADFRHLSNRVEPEVVEALTLAVQAAYPRLSHRYYKMKAKWLGMDALNHWDRNAPLPETPSAVIEWDDAKTTVLDAYSGFAPEMADIARNFFDRNWIDAAMRPGKAPGAFAHPTVPSVHPYVLINYQGKPRDVMTLAH